MVSRNVCQKSVRVNFRNLHSVPSFNFFFVKSIWRRVFLLRKLISRNYWDKLHADLRNCWWWWISCTDFWFCFQKNPLTKQQCHYILTTGHHTIWTWSLMKYVRVPLAQDCCHMISLRIQEDWHYGPWVPKKQRSHQDLSLGHF